MIINGVSSNIDEPLEVILSHRIHNDDTKIELYLEIKNKDEEQTRWENFEVLVKKEP